MIQTSLMNTTSKTTEMLLIAESRTEVMPHQLPLPALLFTFVIYRASALQLKAQTKCPEECYQNVQAEPQKLPTTNDQCPCVKAPGSNTCLTYDTRIQATTIEEALYKFPDIGSYDAGNKPLVTKTSDQVYAPMAGVSPMVSNAYLKAKVASAPIPQQETTTEDDYSCNTVECQSCKALVIDGFKRDAENKGFNMSQITTTPATIDKTFCERKRSRELNQNKPSARIQLPTTPSSTINQIIDLLQPKGRKRRDTSLADGTKLLGVATKIGCDYRRGDEIASGWTGLCNLCWQWRQLPSDYYPTFLNEVSCDSADGCCLSGFGSCRPVLRPVNVLKNLGTTDDPKWEQQSINQIVACECQVELGTTLHQLVAR